MTPERRKAVLFLSLTLVIGILIGSMLPGLFFRMRHKEWKEHGRSEKPHDRQDMRKHGFEKKIYEITKADSSQIKAIKPILDETSAKIDALQQQTFTNVSAVMDSMRMKLKPLLREEQMKSLDDFSQKVRARRRGEDRR